MYAHCQVDGMTIGLNWGLEGFMMNLNTNLISRIIARTTQFKPINNLQLLNRAFWGRFVFPRFQIPDTNSSLHIFSTFIYTFFSYLFLHLWYSIEIISPLILIDEELSWKVVPGCFIFEIFVIVNIPWIMNLRWSIFSKPNDKFCNS